MDDRSIWSARVGQLAVERNLVIYVTCKWTLGGFRDTTTDQDKISIRNNEILQYCDTQGFGLIISTTRRLLARHLPLHDHKSQIQLTFK